MTSQKDEMLYSHRKMNTEIDEALYSRQLYVLGHEAMRHMSEANVLISGMRGLGAEIAKNLILAGVKSVMIHDPFDFVHSDLSSQFFAKETDIGKNRAETSVSELRELNSYVMVDSFTGHLTEEFLNKFQVVILTHTSLEEQLRINDLCHGKGIHFVLADTKGLFGQIFCDFGEKFKVLDTNGEPPSQYHIHKIIKGVETNILLDDVNHMFDDGDLVTFSEIQGMTELNLVLPQAVKVTGPHTLSIGDTSQYGDYKCGGLVTSVKSSVEMNFKSLRDSMNQPSFETKIFDLKRVQQSHLAFTTLHEFVKRNRILPKPWSKVDADQFLEIASSVNNSRAKPLDSINEDLLIKFSFCASGDLSPIQGIIGGIAAQEVLKALSGKFTPIDQWLYYDALDCLPNGDPITLQEICEPTGSRYDGQIAVFGKEFQQELAKTNIFLVGAGAIGCEMLKNWAMMGIGLKSHGQLTITDMDTIEKSNLNRQFLFRPKDVEKLKSVTAAAAVQLMNPDLNIVSHENRVGPETENIYNDDFFDSLTGVVNALDNVEARKYMDKRCVYNCKPMFDSGTLGARCSFQVVLPNLTQCYSDTRDTPEKSYPMCTLKHFPIAIEHTLQWARDEFEGLFKQSVETSMKYLSEADFVENTKKLGGSKSMEMAKELKLVLIDMAPKSFEDCVAWGRRKFQENYTNQIKQLLHVFPPDHVTTSGVPFWSGSKLCPTPLEFSVDNIQHLDYVEATANLVAQIFGLPISRDRKNISSLAAKVSVDEFQLKSNIQIPTTDEEAKEAANREFDSATQEEFEAIIRALLPRKQDQTGGKLLNPLHFEKDDDSNFHMDFIVAASNLRAENYGISPADHHKSKLIAGKIIPAIATTTSVVVGFVCLEIYKWIQGIRQIEMYKNGFINLATVNFIFTRPSAAMKKKYGDVEFTKWDRFEVKSEVTLQQLIEYFLTEHHLTVDMIGYEKSVLYSPVFTANPAERLALPVTKAIEAVTKKPIPAYVQSVQLDLGCCDENDEDLEVPYVKYKIHRDSA